VAPDCGAARDGAGRDAPGRDEPGRAPPSAAMARSAAMRFSTAGCVVNSPSKRRPASGLTMNRWAEAGLR